MSTIPHYIYDEWMRRKWYAKADAPLVLIDAPLKIDVPNCKSICRKPAHPKKHNASNNNGQKLLITLLLAFDIRSLTPLASTKLDAQHVRFARKRIV